MFFTGNEINGVYKFPENCKGTDCTYFVEWKTINDLVHFTIMTDIKDSINIGLSTEEHSVSIIMYSRTIFLKLFKIQFMIDCHYFYPKQRKNLTKI